MRYEKKHMYFKKNNYIQMKINILIALCLLACGCKKTLEPSNALKSPSSAGVAVNAVDFSKFKVVVRLHPSEDYFPMEPVDFIKKSRFRHERSGSDEGYNKNSNKFVRNNSHNSEYYDIPVNVINGYGLESSGRNRRPKDDHKGDYNVFLEPDDNLQGDHDPNTRVSSFLYTPDNVKLQYWLFYGYNYSNVSGLSFSHQGDWESVTLNILNDTIEGAWLSAHGDDKYYDKNALEISIADGVQTLSVYSAKGTHALYNHPGKYHILNSDDASAGGYEWLITGKVSSLESQPWKDYAGAWGEVGQQAATTGPLGPWFKKIN